MTLIKPQNMSHLIFMTYMPLLGHNKRANPEFLKQTRKEAIGNHKLRRLLIAFRTQTQKSTHRLNPGAGKSCACHCSGLTRLG